MNSNPTARPGTTHELSWINLLAGIWLIIAPFVMGATVQAMWNNVILGIIIGILALIRLGSTNAAWASWINGFLGIWVIIAPWVLSYSQVGSRWSNVITGIIVAICGFTTANESPRPIARV